MRINKWALVSLILLFFSMDIQAQYIELGHSRQEVFRRLSEDKKIILKNKKLKVTKFNIIDQINNVSESNKDVQLPIVLEYESYRVPYANIKVEYYFNDKNYCDSMIVIENVCLDCIDFVTLESFYLYWISWNRTSENLFSSAGPFAILSENWSKKTKDKKVAYASLTRDVKPSDGSCKKSIFKLGEEKSYDEFIKEYEASLKNKKITTKTK